MTAHCVGGAYRWSGGKSLKKLLTAADSAVQTERRETIAASYRNEESR
jgi:hypothetical protein